MKPLLLIAALTALTTGCAEPESSYEGPLEVRAIKGTTASASEGTFEYAFSGIRLSGDRVQPGELYEEGGAQPR